MDRHIDRYIRLLSHFVMRGKGWKGQFSNQIYMMHMWYHHKFLIHVFEWDSWIFLSNQSIVSFLHQRQGLFCSCSHENREQNSNLSGRARFLLEQTSQRSTTLRSWLAKRRVCSLTKSVLNACLRVDISFQRMCDDTLMSKTATIGNLGSFDVSRRNRIYAQPRPN